MQQYVEELFEDLSYEMAPVPCAGQELFRNEIKRQFGELCTTQSTPAQQPRPSTFILDSAPFLVLRLEHLPCLQMASCR